MTTTLRRGQPSDVRKAIWGYCRDHYSIPTMGQLGFDFELVRQYMAVEKHGISGLGYFAVDGERGENVAITHDTLPDFSDLMMEHIVWPDVILLLSQEHIPACEAWWKAGEPHGWNHNDHGYAQVHDEIEAMKVKCRRLRVKLVGRRADAILRGEDPDA